MRHKWLFIVIPVVALIIFAFMAGALMYLISGVGDSSSSLFSGGRVGVLEVKGMIVQADETIKDIESIRRDDDVKSVVLRIDSPGGSVGSSQEILEAIRILREDKPVVASMGAVAASGGYYIACGADEIMANPGTITGSIGVRMEHVAIGDLLKWAKIDRETLKTGRFKDIGSIERPLDPEEKALIQGVLDELHDQFTGTIAEARELERADVDALADGRIFTGLDAKQRGLVDEIGGFARAIRRAAELGGIEGEPELAYPPKRGGLVKRLMEGAASMVQSLSGSAVEYWRPVMTI